MRLSDGDDQYKVPLIAKLLHSLPHYNITFHRTNNTFRPTNEVYLESLGILGSVPAALLIISLFGLLLYLITRCCDRKPRPAHSITSLKVTLSVVTVLCCAAIGLGLYGNDDLHNGLLEVLTAGRKVDNIVSSVRNHTNILENTLALKIRPQLVELEDIFEQATSNQTALSILLISLKIVQGNVTVAINAASDIRRPLMGITMSSFLTKGDQWELIRWPGTVAVLALLLVLCAVLLVGVARHSRCALILFSVCGLLAVTGSWLMSGLYLSTSVAVGDLCIDPADYLVSEAPSELPTEVLLYYTQCETARSNPFTQRLRESQNAINNARSAMTTVSRISLVLFKTAGLQPKLGAVTADLNNSERLLTQLTTLVDCRLVHYSYLNATRALCEGGLLGLVLMLVASFIAALLLTVMVWVDSHTWIYIRKRNDYAQVEEPSYISHQMPPNHQTMSRTLPRNHNGPPAISGSHTLQHPRNNKHNEMIVQHQQNSQNLRQLGTHTLGRLPSHNHSPSHHGKLGPNNAACSDPKHPHPNYQYVTHHPSHPPHPQSFQQPQQSLQSSQAHYQQLPPPQQHSQHSHIQHLPSIQKPNNQEIYSKVNSGIYSSATMRRPPVNSVRDSVEAIPSSNTVDSAMYERDKQIYKCSTMRPPSKLDNSKCMTMPKPSILNCPLPEIPKPKDDDSSVRENIKMDKVQPMVTRTLHRPIKNLPTGKAIPPPKIVDICPPKQLIEEKLPPPPPSLLAQNSQQQNHQYQLQKQQQQRSQMNQQNDAHHQKQSPPPPTPPPPPELDETPINPNDESNYAVTEL